MADAEAGQVEAHSFRSISQEAAGIAQICRQLVDEGELEPGQILILLRSDPRGIYSAPIIEALNEHGLDAEHPATRSRSSPTTFLANSSALCGSYGIVTTDWPGARS